MDFRVRKIREIIEAFKKKRPYELGSLIWCNFIVNILKTDKSQLF